MCTKIRHPVNNTSKYDTINITIITHDTGNEKPSNSPTAVLPAAVTSAGRNQRQAEPSEAYLGLSAALHSASHQPNTNITLAYYFISTQLNWWRDSREASIVDHNVARPSEAVTVMEFVNICHL